MKTSEAFTKPLSPAGVVVALAVILTFFVATHKAIDDEPREATQATPATFYELQKADYLERQRAARRVESERTRAGVRLFCREVGEQSAACRDMEIATGLAHSR